MTGFEWVLQWQVFVFRSYCWYFLGNFNKIFCCHHCQIAWQALYKCTCKYLFWTLNFPHQTPHSWKNNICKIMISYRAMPKITKWDYVETMKEGFSVSHYFEIEHFLLDKGIYAHGNLVFSFCFCVFAYVILRSPCSPFSFLCFHV